MFNVKQVGVALYVKKLKSSQILNLFCFHETLFVGFICWNYNVTCRVFIVYGDAKKITMAYKN
jgi:hypothetical protein